MAKDTKSIYKDPVFTSYWHERSGKEGQPYARYVVDPAMFRWLGDLSNAVVLELGCGNGYLAKSFIKKGAAEVLCTDISKHMLDYARTMCTDSRVQFKELDATKKWRLPSHSFDVVVSNMMFNQVKDLHLAFSQAHRVLVERGKFIFSVTHPAWDLFIFAQERAGIKSNKIKGVKGYFSRGFSNYVMGKHSKSKPELGLRYKREFLVPHFHRPLSDYFNTLTDAGFEVIRVLEPMVNRRLLKDSPGFADYLDHPVGLIFCCLKKS
jgi:ubiquinone/menaquinone biosynthesis C-methylase UbiE